MRLIKLPALKIKQGNQRQLFSIAVDGKQISQVAAISRIGREDENLSGYQRPEVQNHIREIQAYIESENPMIPNPIIIAFDSRVSFEPLAGNQEMGHLLIPVSDEEGFEKPGFIVDGQQRTAALREAEVDNFVMPVSAFIADSEADQREQFMLVNSTKPLPKALLYELAPHTDGRLPTDLQLRKFPSKITQRLNYEPGPLYKLIKTATNPDGWIADNSIIKLVDSSLRDGALYNFRDPDTGEGNEDLILETLNNFWTAVQAVFPEAWDTPKKSRLLHGAGVAALGSLMDTLHDEYLFKHRDEENLEELVTSVKYFQHELEVIQEACAWTKGVWRFGTDVEGVSINRKWNEVQNVSRDIVLLTDFLQSVYRNDGDLPS
ncbi:DGQHR domain-containing protein DpdB [Corallincola platygyrae]|uniref:DGQHR domain-containing protein DpdB n=1 Tax=Corallincola platygyrae TaxID=1193278 RepID=A0ABW4XKZ5_9GAMM